MAQAMQVGTFEAPISMDKKTYSVSFKGLMAHFLDILFGKTPTVKAGYAADLSGYMQKDIGLYR